MRPIQRVISIGFATAAIAAASMPALSWTVWPDVDFEWYANVGRTATQPSQPSQATTVRQDDSLVTSAPASSSDLRSDARATASDEPSRPIATSNPEGRIVPTLPD